MEVNWEAWLLWSWILYHGSCGLQMFWTFPNFTILFALELTALSFNPLGLSGNYMYHLLYESVTVQFAFMCLV
jgi:hypothetical protein